MINEQNNQTTDTENPGLISPISKTTFHKHNGVDAPKIKLENIQGINNIFQIVGVADATIAPTFIPQYSPFVIQYDSTHWRLWIRVNSLWKSAAFT